MRARFRVIPLLVAAVTVAAACGDDDDDDDTAATEATEATESDAAPETTAAAADTTAAAPATTEATSDTATTAPAAEDAATWTCVNPDEPEPEPGTEVVWSWGGGSTKAGVERFVKPLVEEELGFELTVVGAAGTETMGQMVGQGGAGDLDIVITSYQTLEQGRAADILETIDFSVLPNTQALDPRHLDPGGEDKALTVTEFAYGLAYNPDMLAERGLPEPTKIEDMLNPVYGPVLGIYTPPFAGAVSQLAVINAVLGGPQDDYSAAISALADLEGQHIANSALMETAYTAGEVGMYFSASATSQALVDDGVPSKMVFNPAYGSGIYAIIGKGAEQAGAACMIMNLLVSPEGAEALQQVNGNLPTRRDGVTLRSDSLMFQAAQEEEILSYPDLLTGAPPAEQLTEQWNQAVAG